MNESKVAEFLEELVTLSKKHGLYIVGGNIEDINDEVIAERIDYAGDEYDVIVL
jgi:ribonucleotide reductase beta subunit family protein with ferritin-like domain